MALTPSSMQPLGSPAPSFTLQDAGGASHRLEDFSAPRALVVAFWCNHCPYVKFLKEHFAAMAAELQARGAAIVAINSNSPLVSPGDSREKMAEDIATYGYTFPYLIDEAQTVAKAFGATCTPDFFVYGPERTLVYRGQYDDSRPGNPYPTTGADLRAAVEAVLAGSMPAKTQHPSIGCNIKWAP